MHEEGNKDDGVSTAIPLGTRIYELSHPRWAYPACITHLPVSLVGIEQI